ncbi:MAG: hypothetical protein ACYDGX_09785, partial [Thermoleophilia bacterium]
MKLPGAARPAGLVIDGDRGRMPGRTGERERRHPVASFKNVLERAYRCLTKNVAETVCGFSSFLSSFILLALKVK